jgi:hypothetical protein
MRTDLHDAMARTEYALILVKQGRIAETETQIEEASRLCARNGNNAQIACFNKLIQDINKNA